MRIEEKIFNKEQLISGFSSEEIKIMNFKWVLLKQNWIIFVNVSQLLNGRISECLPVMVYLLTLLTVPEKTVFTIFRWYRHN